MRPENPIRLKCFKMCNNKRFQLGFIPIQRKTANKSDICDVRYRQVHSLEESYVQFPPQINKLFAGLIQSHWMEQTV